MQEFTGLNSSEVKERESKGLTNKSSRHKTKAVPEILIENIFSLFNLIIFGIIIFVLIFYFRTKELNLLLDSLGIFTIALINTLIGIFQEIKAKRALDKVSLLLKKQVTVLRDGTETGIEQTDIVTDDIIKLNRGDQIVVDGKIIYSKRLEIDESLLTGESLPVEKKVNDNVLSGSFCVSGAGYYKAEKVGDESYAHSVTALAKKYKITLTPLQRKINLILKTLFGAAICLVALEIILGNSETAHFGNIEFIRKIATILISLVPQGLVLFSSVTFAIGVYRISKIGAIIQKLNAIESFSSVKIVCMDKTGTLTENKLNVQKIINLNNELPEQNIRTLLGTYSRLSSEKNATINALEKFDYSENAKVIDELPFSSERKMSIIHLKFEDNSGDFQSGAEQFFILGAYDILLEKISPELKKEADNQYKYNDLKNFRNLLFGTTNSIADTGSIDPICIISISDTPRQDVYKALELFKEKDIMFKILSGDSAEAIKAVTSQIGWEIEDSRLITGNELDKLDEKVFDNIIYEKVIFARLKPEHKLKIIKSFKKQKIYTAMIGDGVNDLPAIKESDMGIAMEEGSRITKEIADIVLLKNKFSLLPEIFNEGNKIVNSVNSVAKLFLTKNFIIIYISLLSLFFLLDFPLTPRRVSLLNIFAIGLPAYIIAVRNKNISRCTNFTRDVFSFVTISAAVIMFSGYIGTGFSSIHNSQVSIIMLSIMIIIAIMNFIIVSLNSNDKIFYYILYGALLLILFLFFSVFNFDNVIFKYIKLFYEIDYINPESWIIIIICGVSGSLVLLFLQSVRKKIFKI